MTYFVSRLGVVVTVVKSTVKYNKLQRAVVTVVFLTLSGVAKPNTASHELRNAPRRHDMDTPERTTNPWAALRDCAKVALVPSTTHEGKFALFATDVRKSDKTFDFSVNDSDYMRRNRAIETSIDSQAPVALSPAYLSFGDTVTLRKFDADGVACTITAQLGGALSRPKLTILTPRESQEQLPAPQASPIIFVNNSSRPLPEIKQYTYTPRVRTNPIPAPSRPQPPASNSQTHSSYEAEFFAKLNQYRASRGLRPVKPNADLTQIASRNNQLQRQRGLGHHVSRGYQNAGWNYHSVDQILAGWKNSPGHNANLLQPSITTAGVAYDGTYWTFEAI